MSKVAMFTMGTRGDVQPYIFLSKELIRNGFDVTLGSHPCWRLLDAEQSYRVLIRLLLITNCQIQ